MSLSRPLATTDPVFTVIDEIDLDPDFNIPFKWAVVRFYRKSKNGRDRLAFAVVPCVWLLYNEELLRKVMCYWPGRSAENKEATQRIVDCLLPYDHYDKHLIDARGASGKNFDDFQEVRFILLPISLYEALSNLTHFNFLSMVSRCLRILNFSPYFNFFDGF